MELLQGCSRIECCCNLTGLKRYRDETEKFSNLPTHGDCSPVEDFWLRERQLRLPEDAVLKNHRCILGARPCSDIAKKTL